MRVKKWLVLVVLIALFFCPFAVLAAPATQAQIRLSFFFDKPSYVTTDSFLGLIQVSTSGTAQNVKLSFEIREAREKKVLFEKTFTESSLGPGLSQFDVSSDLTTIGVSQGVYPVEISLYQQGELVQELETNLVVVNQLTPPLHLALVLSVEEGIHHNAAGVFVDEDIPHASLADPRSPGLYFDLGMLVKEHTQTAFNIHLSSTLLDQLDRLSKGYVYDDGKEKMEVLSTSEEALGVQKTITLFQKLDQGRVDWLFSPYGDLPFPALLKRGWQEDLETGILKGREITKKVLQPIFDPPGLYPPQLQLSEEAFSLIKGKARYVVVDQNLIQVSGEGRSKSYIPPFSNQDVVVFPVNSRLSKAMKRKSEPYLLSQKIIGELAQVYLKESGEKVVTLRLPEERPALIEAFLTLVSKTPWINMEQLSDLTHLAEADFQYELVSPSISDEKKAFFSWVGKYRELVYLFFETALGDNPQRGELNELLLQAESFGVNKPTQNRELAQTFFSEIESTIKANWEKFSISREKITLTSQSGKVPFSIINGTSQPYKVKLSFASLSPKLSLKEAERLVVLNPKENTFFIPVMTDEPGDYKIKVSLLTPESEKTIKETEVEVRSTYFTRLFSLFALVLVILPVLLIIRVRKKRQLV
jgi:hypothetical protein